MKTKVKVNYVVDMGMLLAFLICGLTGILKIPELAVPFSDSYYMAATLLHDWSGVVLVALAGAHTLLHGRWLIKMTKKISESRKTRRFRAAPGVLTVLLTLLLLGVFSGELSARSRHSYNATIPDRIDYENAELADGTYRGTAEGYEPGITVDVTVEDGKIANIEFVSHSETRRWFYMVVNRIPERILGKQSTDVDIVSGATASSLGIMSAVEDALQQAVK